MARFLKGEKQIELSSNSMLGALCNYITFPEHKRFQPINSNWGIVEPVDILKELENLPEDSEFKNLPPRKARKNKKLKTQLLSKRAIEYLSSLV